MMVPTSDRLPQSEHERNAGNESDLNDSIQVQVLLV